MPFVIIEFGQLEETIGEQLEEKMVIEKYLLKKNIYYVVGQEASLGFSYKSVCVY